MMTHPTHGLDPNALEAARKWPDLAAIEAAARKVNPGRSEDHIKSVALDALSIIRALSQNPGTSNTSGEAGPVAWRFKADDPHYDDAYVYCATEEMALLRCPKNSKVEPLYATLEPRASDREAVIDEIEAIIDAKVAEIDGQIPNSPRMRGRIGYAIERLSELRDAICKLSEVSHEH